MNRPIIAGRAGVLPPGETQEAGDDARTFMDRVSEALTGCSFVKLVLGKYRGSDPSLKSVVIQIKVVKGRDCLSFVYRHQTKEVTRNASMTEGLMEIRDRLGAEFKSAHLFSMKETVQIEFNKKGRCRISLSEPVCEALPSHAHDHVKNRLIDPARPFLAALGITNDRHQVFPSMFRKWKQINVFLELFHRAWDSSRASGADPVSVVDFGSGKGYLTFAVHDHLRVALGVEAQVTGIELRDDLVQFCSDVAGRLGLSGLSFRQGDITSYSLEPMQVMIALHACDTATDLAIHAGIRGGAEIIMCAPCCHKELRSQLVVPPVLQPMLQIGVHLGQEAEMVTDSLRALWLEASGYEAQVFEFISLEHTSKNKMILAVKRSNPVDPQPIMAKIQALKAFYGIKTQALETLH